ncbi:MAG: hypothetical protein DRP37_02300 [Thermodesulfobacteriota bacterium]|nr:MAG: hypothetical protein DRP37_02300 [Thermodesulfobacteriota bacterium]
MYRKLFKYLYVVILILFLAHPILAGVAPEFKITQGSGDAVNVYVENATDLGAFEIELSYDKNQIEVISIQKGELVRNSQRVFSQLGPKIDPSGKVTFGFFSFGNTAGISGSGVLADIQYSGDSSSLKILKVKATDSKGNVLQ